VAAIRRHTDLYLDCHLMMTNPGDFLAAFAEAGANGVSVHIEVDGTADLFAEMRQLGLDVGLAVNPDTPFEAYEKWLPELDLVLVMTVFPGFGGQKFMAEVMPKLAQTRAAIAERGLNVSVEVDGGIDERPQRRRHVRRRQRHLRRRRPARCGPSHPRRRRRVKPE
jgi:ribulose-phosphate 3-epimerase